MLSDNARREGAADAVFNLRKAKFKKMLGKIVTAGKPMQGPWYMVYLKPNFVLKAMPLSQEQALDHPVFWRQIVDDTIVPFYGLKDPSVIREVKNIPYCCPRGRVALMIGGRKEWVAWCGNDFEYSTAEKKAVISAFNLGEQALAGLFRFGPDDHEIVVRYDFERFLKLVTGMDKSLKRITVQEPMAD